MQRRSNAYQAVISLTRQYSGVQFHELVEAVAIYVSPSRACDYRLAKLKRTPHETHAETTLKGQHELARKYIDSANRQGLIFYAEAVAEDNSRRRFVYWRRFARNGGRYGLAEAGEEIRRHSEFMRLYQSNQSDEGRE